MNKHFLILLVCMNAAFTLSAQYSMNLSAGRLPSARQNPAFREAIRNSRKTYNLKTTSIGERLRAQSTYRFLDTAGTGVNLWLLNDSTYYLYSGSHGSEFDYTDLNYWDDFTLFNNGYIGIGTAMGRNDNFINPMFFSTLPIVFTDMEILYPTPYLVTIMIMMIIFTISHKRSYTGLSTRTISLILTTATE